jgi:RNA polymerase sigma factor (TIGR02999 family)
MAMQDSLNITALLRAWTRGDRAALEPLIPALYEDLRRTAAAYMRGERPDHTLQPTALVNEAWLRLMGMQRIEWKDRSHFFATSAQLMRRVLVDHARTRACEKRGGGADLTVLSESIVDSTVRDEDIIAVDEALRALAEIDARKAKVVELRYFLGLSVEETAVALDVSPQTVLRDWSISKAWLGRHILQNRYV